MDSQTVTLTLPFTAQQFWVFTIALSLIALSAAIVYVAGKRVEKERLPKDWLRDSLMIAGGLLAPIWAALLFMVLSALWHLAWQMPDVIAEGTNTDLRWHTISIVGAVTATAAILGAPLAMIRVAMTERQTRATEEGLITDRINKAVEGLGAVRVTKQQRQDQKGNLTYAKKKNDFGVDVNDYSQPVMMETTEPNLEVRVGALYALERLTHDSTRDRTAILNILIAYLSNNSLDASSLRRNSNDEIEIQDQRTDIKVALNIIEKFSAEIIDLSGISFRHCDLTSRYFSNRKLDYSTFQGCNLTGASFENSTFVGADFSNSYLGNTTFKNAIFLATKFHCKTLFKANFSGAYFDATSLTDLKQRHGINVSGAALRKLNLHSSHLFLENTKIVFGDASVTLPNGIDPNHDDWPSHWSSDELDDEDFNTQWRQWQRSIGFQPDENQQ